jgi:hypothetical protein
MPPQQHPFSLCKNPSSFLAFPFIIVKVKVNFCCVHGFKLIKMFPRAGRWTWTRSERNTAFDCMGIFTAACTQKQFNTK